LCEPVYKTVTTDKTWNTPDPFVKPCLAIME